MKNTVFFLLSAFLLGCSTPSPQELLISEYVQKLDDTKIDLKFKLISLEFINDITAGDSLAVFKPTFEEERALKIAQLYETIADDKEEIIESKNSLKNPGYLKQFYIDQIKRDEADIVRTEEVIKIYETDCKGTFLEPIYTKVSYYEQLGDRVLAKNYLCNYSIFNPILQTTQEIKKHFYFSPDETKIIGSGSQ